MAFVQCFHSQAVLYSLYACRTMNTFVNLRVKGGLKAEEFAFNSLPVVLDKLVKSSCLVQILAILRFTL